MSDQFMMTFLFGFAAGGAVFSTLILHAVRKSAKICVNHID